MLTRIFGNSGTARRYGWYVFIGIVVFSAGQCWNDCSPTKYGFMLLATTFMLVLLVAAQLPVRQMLMCGRHMRQIRKKLDPVAEAMDAKPSIDTEYTEYDPYYRLKLKYSFPDGTFVVLDIHPKHFTSWTPNWNPGHEKNTEGLPIFLRAIQNLKDVGG